MKLFMRFTLIVVFFLSTSLGAFSNNGNYSNRTINGINTGSAAQNSCVKCNFSGSTLNAESQGSNNSLGYLNFTNANFSGAKLNGWLYGNVNFTGADLSGATLQGGFLSGNTNFSKANFSHATIATQSITYQGSGNFSKANFTSTDFKQTFNNTNFSGAQFIGSKLSSSFTNCNFTGATFSGVGLKGINWNGSNFTNANFSNADLSDANLSGTNLTGVDFNKIKGGTLSNLNVQNANLTSTNFSGMTFDGTFSGANFTEANLSNVKASGQNLSGANFTQTNVNGADFSNVNFNGATFDTVDLKTANIKGATLTGVKFPHMNLSGYDFSGYNLTNADFSLTTLGNSSSSSSAGTNFAGANLTNAKFALLPPAPIVRPTRPSNSAPRYEIFGYQRAMQMYWRNYDNHFAQMRNYQNQVRKNKNLLNIDFSNANLTGANFYGLVFGNSANLSGANFYNAQLKGTSFKEANPIGAKSLVLALFNSDNKDGVQDVLNNGYVITSQEMDELGAHFTLSQGSSFASQIQKLEKSYKKAKKAAAFLKSNNMPSAAATETAKATALKKQIASLKQKQSAQSAEVEQKESSTGQGVIMTYMANLGQKLIDAMTKSDSATALKLANQAGQITLKQLSKYLNLYQSPLQYTSSNNQEPLIMAMKMNFPNVAKAILEGLQTTIGKTQALAYINTLNPFSIVMDSFMSGGDTTIAAQIAQTLIDTGIPVPPIPPLISRLKAAGIKNVELAEVAGDFKKQCRNLKLDTQKNYLWGECKKLNGDYNGATWVSPVLPITLSDGTQYTPFIGNRNGGLFDYNYQNGTPLVKGDFWKSCWSIRYDQESNGVYAVCGKGQGYISPALPVTLPDGTNYVPNIVEYNKRLTDKNYQDGKGPVQGTFWKSCMNVRLGIKNNVIYGLCGKGLSNIGPAMPVKLANGKTYTPLVGEYSGKLLDFNYKDGKGILKGDFWKYCENIIFYIERGLVTYTYQKNGKSKSGALGNVKPGDALSFKDGKLVKEN